MAIAAMFNVLGAKLGFKDCQKKYTPHACLAFCTTLNGNARNNIRSQTEKGLK